MFSDIVIEFENVTKFKLSKYFEDYRDFMQDDFSFLSDYYAGRTESVSTEVMGNFNSLLTRSRNLVQTFKNYSSKLSNCGFWELQQYCQNLNDTLERVSKLPKYNRVVESVRGYQPYVQVKADIGGMKTPQDLADEIDSLGVTETSLLLDNDFQEDDWEIDKLSSMKAIVNNQSDLVVESIIEAPVGNHVYGKDINKKITIKDNDLDIKRYEDNVEQKIDTLLKLNRGDIPEIPTFGKNILQGKTAGSYNYAELLKDIQQTFLQDDLFESVSVSSVELKDSDLYVTCNIRTKYAYSTVKTFVL